MIRYLTDFHIPTGSGLLFPEKEASMFDKGQKEFIIEFGLDERIEVTDLNFKGSKGYVNKIIIDRNGIWYEVILTEIVNQSKGILKSEAIRYPAGFLKSLDV